MKRLLVAAVLAAGCGQRSPGEDTSITALVGATVIDVVGGREIPDATVLVRDGRILAVGESAVLPVPDGAMIERLDGRWVIPGLIDAHTHLQAWGLALSLDWGVTSVRDLHAGAAHAVALRTAADEAPAARLFAAMVMLDGVPSTYSDAVALRSPDDAEPAVDSVFHLGASWIKGYTRISPELLDAVMVAARARRLPVAVHLGLTDALTAARLGVTSIEHLSGIPEALDSSGRLAAAHRQGFFAGWTAFEKGWITPDTAALARLAEQLAATGVFLVPTLGLHEIFARLDDSTVQGRAELASVPDSARQNWDVAGMITRAGWTPADFADFRAARAGQDAMVRRFAAAGGRLATGSDASNQLLVPGAGVHLEMELLVSAGLSPLEALRAATMHGADLLRADSLGRLRPNAVADLVVLGADPLRAIVNTRRIERVMLGGVWVR